MIEKAGRTLAAARLAQDAIEPAEKAACLIRGLERGRGAAPLIVPWGQIFVRGSIAQLGHQIEALALGHESRYRRGRIPEVAEVARACRADRDAGRDAFRRREVLVVDAVDAQRAFL